MRWITAIWLAAFSAGCSDPTGDAEDQYNIVVASGDNADKCAAAGKVRDAWLKAKNQSKYETWALRTRIACTSAEIDRMQP